jgi:leucyl-tRNA synthetase
VVQVNGKVRGRVKVPAEADNATVEAVALADGNVQRFIEGKPVRKLIVVPKKLVNIVV